MGVSGALVDRVAGMLPLEDIAQGLSRMPRFAGQTVFPWMVVDHLVCCVRYWRHYQPKHTLKGTTPLLALHLLLHDAHEAMTGDIPTTFKTEDMRALQKQLDERMYTAFGVPMPNTAERALIKVIDERMLIAEAKICTPENTYRRIVFERNASYCRAAVKAVEEHLHEDGDPQDTFLALARQLLNDARSWYGLPVRVG